MTIGKKLRRFVGGALFLIGAVSLLVLLISVYSIGQMMSVIGQDMEFWSIPRVVKRTAYIIFLFAICLTGIGIYEGRKIVILYLRRFGLSTIAVNPRSRGGIGRSFRIITLQDGQFNPAGIGGRSLWGSILVLVFLFALIIGLSIIFSNMAMRGFSETNSGGWLAALVFQTYCTWIGISILTMFLCYQLLLEWYSDMRVRNRAELSDTLARVRWMSSRINQPSLLARRSTVVRVVDKLWRKTVLSLATSVHVALIDVSDPSEHVIWELNALKNAGIPYILIADSNAVKSPTNTSSDKESSFNHIGIDTPTILPYDSKNSSKLAEFQQSLTSAIIGKSLVRFPLFYRMGCNQMLFVFVATVQLLVVIGVSFIVGILFAGGVAMPALRQMVGN